MPTHLRLLMFLWSFVAMSTNAKTYLPNIDWILSGLLFLGILPYSRPNISLPQLLLAAAILAAGITGGMATTGFVWAGKLTMIFLCTSCLASAPGRPRRRLRDSWRQCSPTSS